MPPSPSIYSTRLLGKYRDKNFVVVKEEDITNDGWWHNRDSTSRCQHNDAVTIGEYEMVSLRLDVLGFYA